MDYITPIVARIKGQCPILRDARSVLVADQTSAQPPYAWVLPLAEKAQQIPLLGVHAERVTVSVGVEMMIRNLRGQEAAAVTLDDVRDEIKAALCGWTPLADPSATPLVFASGEMTAWETGRAQWLDRYTFTYETRSYQ